MNNQSKIKYALNELIKGDKFTDIGDIFSKNYLSHVGEKQYRGQAIIKKWSKELNSTFSNLKVSNLIFFTENEDTIVWQRTLKGKHTNSIKGILASGKMIQWNEIIISRFVEGKIEEEWIVSELLGKLLLKAPK